MSVIKVGYVVVLRNSLTYYLYIEMLLNTNKLKKQFNTKKILILLSQAFSFFLVLFYKRNKFFGKDICLNKQKKKGKINIVLEFLGIFCLLQLFMYFEDLFVWLKLLTLFKCVFCLNVHVLSLTWCFRLLLYAYRICT